MNVRRIVGTEPSLPPDSCRTAVGIQGRQGCNRYYHYDMDCKDLAYITKTENSMNIYNYFKGTGCTPVTGPRGATGLSGPVFSAPTETYAYGYFNFSRSGGYNLTVTTDGIKVPFQCDYYHLNGINKFQDSSDGYTRFRIFSHGIYEISYQVYLKSQAAIGARVRQDSSIISSSVILPDSEAAELSGSCTIRIYSWYDISLELFSETEVDVTLKGGLGAAIMIKKLAAI